MALDPLGIADEHPQMRPTAPAPRWISRTRWFAALALALAGVYSLPAAGAQETVTVGSNGSFTVGGGKSSPATGTDTGGADHGGGDGGASGAAPGGPTDDQYVDITTHVARVPSAPPSAPSGALPFTGFDLGAISVVAALLVGLGVALRRFRRNALDA